MKTNCQKCNCLISKNKIICPKCNFPQINYNLIFSKIAINETPEWYNDNYEEFYDEEDSRPRSVHKERCKNCGFNHYPLFCVKINWIRVISLIFFSVFCFPFGLIGLFFGSFKKHDLSCEECGETIDPDFCPECGNSVFWHSRPDYRYKNCSCGWKIN
jgi:RNA polymerase subunit RPABC4/transcription elongation factor Spt4